MEKRKAKRTVRNRSPISKVRLEKWRGKIAQELPDLLRRNKLAQKAMQETAFSGCLRRAIQESPNSPMTIAKTAGLDWADLDDFLTGEATLPSDVIDRLVKAVKLKVASAKRNGAAKAS